MLRREFFTLLANATVALTVPPNPLVTTTLPKLTEIFPSDLLDRFLDSRILNTLRFGLTQQDQENPYQCLRNASSHIMDLLNCLNHPDQPKFQGAPPNFHFLQVMGEMSLGEQEPSKGVSLKTWSMFRTALNQRIEALCKLEDSELIKIFPQTNQDILAVPDYNQISDPIIRHISRGHRSRILQNQALVPSIRKILASNKEDPKSLLFKINQTLQTASPESREKNADCLALLEHLQESGFSPFPKESRLAKLEEVAKIFRQFQANQGICAKFDLQKILADQLHHKCKELGFNLPSTEIVESTRFSQNFGEHQDRIRSSSNQRESSYHNHFRKQENFPENIFLIYNYSPKGPIVNFLLPTEKRFVPTHVHFSQSFNRRLASVIWAYAPRDKLMNSDHLLLKIAWSQNEISIKIASIEEALGVT